MSTPAERYAAARQRQADAGGGLRDFAEGLPYTLDDFQVRACRALLRDAGVLVAAPTGSGKTVVGEFAAYLALRRGGRAFYTTPIKALSNQKFREFQAAFGAHSVGLLTGDTSVNPDAPVVVMTTEVLRNMVYADPAGLAALHVVVMDEVHYLADRARGSVWEEVIIHLPAPVKVVALSATVSNAEEFGRWLGQTRGDVEVVVEEHRPVPLDQHVFIDGRVHPLFSTGTAINSELAATARRLNRPASPRQRPHRPSRIEVVEELEGLRMLPAVYFIFSRAGCDAALEQCRAAGVRLTTHEERLIIRGIVDDMCASLPDSDLGVLGWHDWRESLQSGVAAHHAGLVPLFKEVVERLFQEGLIKVVFATETLALGINMPARSVVVERLTKWNGSAHVALSAGEYTQLTGRAGRRGLDDHGNAVVVWEPSLDLGHLGGLASTRTYPLASSFRPTYNMAVNLLLRHGPDLAVELLERSFAQFQVDARLAGLNEQSRRLAEAAAEHTEAVACHLGDFSEYFDLRAQLRAAERAASGRRSEAARAEVDEGLRRLHRGDVIMVSRGRRSGFAVVVQTDAGRVDDAARPLVLGVDRVLRRVSWIDVDAPVEVLTRVRIPGAFSVRSATARKHLAALLREATAQVEARAPARPVPTDSESEISDLRTRLRAHPCHGCHDREVHARAAELRSRALRESAQMRTRVDTRAGSLGRQFQRVCAVLTDLGYLVPGPALEVTDAGRVLARVYADLDLLTTEVIRAGLLEDLTPEELAAAAAFCVYEGRTDEARVDQPLKSAALRRTLPEVYRLWSHIVDVESDHGVSTQRPLDAALVRATSIWAAGGTLAEALKAASLPPGDFVRWMKQVIDWLSGVQSAVPPDHPIALTAREATDRVNRGLVSMGPAG